MNSTFPTSDDFDGLKFDENASVIQQRNRDEIRRLDREKKDAAEQQKQEIQSLKVECQNLKDKFEQSKTRNTVLTNEVKTLREQLKTSLDKSKHDDELVAVLLKQQQQMKTSQEQMQKELDLKSKFNEETEKSFKLDQMKQNNLVKQLQLVIDQKETKIRELEMHLDENRIEVRRKFIVVPKLFSTVDQKREQSSSLRIPSNLRKTFAKTEVFFSVFHRLTPFLRKDSIYRKIVSASRKTPTVFINFPLSVLKENRNDF